MVSMFSDNSLTNESQKLGNRQDSGEKHKFVNNRRHSIVNSAQEKQSISKQSEDREFVRKSNRNRNTIAKNAIPRRAIVEFDCVSFVYWKIGVDEIVDDGFEIGEGR